MSTKHKKKLLPYFLGNTAEEAERLYNTFQRDLSTLSERASRLSHLDKEDLFQEAVMGLAMAARDFENGRSEDFRIFAIYKIKDAIRSYVASQQKDMRIPQYISDTRKLVKQLANIMQKGANLPQHCSLSSVWELSLTFGGDPAIKKEMEGVQESLRNLAARTHTSVQGLIDRVELMPSASESIDNNADVNMAVDPEAVLVEAITNRDAVKRIKEHLSEDEFDLLYKRFVEGYTFRELESVFEITEESINVKVKKIVSRLAEKRGAIVIEDTETCGAPITEASASAAGD